MGILVLQPEIKPGPWQWKWQVSSIEPSGNSLSCSTLNMSSHSLLFCIVCLEKSAVKLLAFPHTWWVMFLLLLFRFSHFPCLSAFDYIFRYGSVCFYSVRASSCFWKYRSMLFFRFQAFSHYFFLYFSFPFFPSFFLLVFLLYIFWYPTFLSGFIHFYSFYPPHISYSIDLS